MKRTLPFRLGLDLGTNSIGWCITDLGKPGKDGRMHPVRIRRMGVRIFPDGRDPQSGASLAEARRTPRSARRRRDRFLDRRADLMKLLIAHGLMPADPAARKALAALDPWALRGEGLDQQLTLHELGRALFHLNQRRGFKSNRRTDKKADDKEAQGMKAGAAALAAKLDGRTPGRRTLGEYFYAAYRKDRTPRGAPDGSTLPIAAVRFRAHAGKGNKLEWDLYPTRDMVEAEFDALWTAQAAHHPALTEEGRAAIRDAIFYQRPLRPVEPGPCTLDPEPDPHKRERRAPLALPLQQEFRILQELANLELRHRRTGQVRRLGRQERDKVLHELKRREKYSFSQIRKLLGIDNVWSFNLQDDRRDGLKGDVVAYKLAKNGFGKSWHDMAVEQQDEVVRFLLDEEREDEVLRVATTSWGLALEAAAGVAGTPLPEGYGRLGRTALARIVHHLRHGVSSKDGGLMHYDEAVQAAGYRHHSDFSTGEVFTDAPYYGQILERYMVPVSGVSGSADEQQYGRITNPTVHVSLNQLRQLLDAIIAAYGHPDEIVVELARELKQTREQKRETQTRQLENQKKNERRKQQLEAAGIALRGDALLRMRLWEELGENVADRACVYTGEPIGIKTLFSDKVEIEHILPFTLTLDDSPSNLTIAMRHANRDKGDRTPHDAFGTSPTIGGQSYDWDAIALRASALPWAKQWRFRADALQLIKDRLLREEQRAKGSLPRDVMADIENTGGFLARQLVDTAYLARVARQYLTSVVPSETVDGVMRSKVWVVPGGMTGMLRRLWGLNRYLWGNRPEAADEGPDDWRGKLRTDHRHHAVDAFVLTLIDRPLLNSIQYQAGQSGRRTIDDMPDPIDWPTFREDLKDRFDRIVVSYKPEHSPSGRLHEETAYGIVREPAKEDGATLVYRATFVDLDTDGIARIRDLHLRARVLAAVEGVTSDKKKLRETLTAFAATEPQALRHVRLLKVKSDYRTILHSRSHYSKAFVPGKNHRVDVFERPDGTWQAAGNFSPAQARDSAASLRRDRSAC
ncbi:type II CRISPR RNA-guided endonuclease Cas9 [Vineibacter terrae]|uniref:CRISPR-associated endonuclease Cas9 n=1 Tax=Vineibacter terrae TaxID=2586908 RepID=A0A5C8PQZ4_9HYPH|nr:type II CRISPR RNA-guided endonuclease Cas9 [Vineibacter terrae]TXL77613.1 type II CRISPR RNA-guided endonuclease Cas9 [Vineibacter terrae]